MIELKKVAGLALSTVMVTGILGAAVVSADASDSAQRLAQQVQRDKNAYRSTHGELVTEKQQTPETLSSVSQDSAQDSVQRLAQQIQRDKDAYRSSHGEK